MLYEALEMMNELIEGEYDPLVFSFDFPWFLIDNYETMKAENQVATDILNEGMPEICAEYERGQNPSLFIEKIKEQYMLVRAATNFI